jgi:hypothetical protein
MEIDARGGEGISYSKITCEMGRIGHRIVSIKEPGGSTMSDERTIEALNKIAERFDIIISLFARQVLDPEKVKERITKGARDKARTVKCFNLCDGKTSITDIAEAAKMDQGGVSRQVDSWEKDGFVFKIEDGQKTYPKALIRIS